MSKIPESIIDHLLDRKCLFFIGSGMSSEAGLPSTKDLVEIMAKKLKSNGVEISSTELKVVAQKFCLRFSRTDLMDLIREEIAKKLKNADRTSFDMLARLTRLPKDIVTTNWDPLIEQTLGTLNYIPIFGPNAVARYNEDAKINLFKIHGDIDHDIVITEDDYREYSQKWRPIVIELLSLFQKRVIVFIGYSAEDENFLEMYLEVLKTLRPRSSLPRYCVDPNVDELREEELRRKDIKPIKMSAREFLKELDKELQERVAMTYRLPSPKTVPVPIRDFNPFGIFRVEDVSDVKWINQTFVKPIDFSTIISPGNVVIEGHRGSGKSMILQYLNYPSLHERQEKSGYVGFYVKLQVSFVDTVKREGMETEEWKRFFLHYFNLILGESILITLRDLLREEIISFTNIGEFVQRVLFTHFPGLSIQTEKMNSLKDLVDVFTRERNRYAVSPRPLPYLSAHFIYDFIKLLEEYVDEFQHKYFYMLIDEYDKLDEDQQKVINIYIADRGAPIIHKVSFKVAVKLFEMSYETIARKILDPVDDYQWVPLDRFDTEKEIEFKEKLIEIGNTRLRFYRYKNESLADLLPSEEPSFEKMDYSGLENILTLSSFLVRDFLELTKDMIYYAYPWVTTEKRDIIPPIPPNIQNFVIKVHSDILYTTKIDEIPGTINDKERKYIARLLVEKMGKIFQNTLKGSKSKEKRTVSSFQLLDEFKLSEKAKTALDDCRSVGALQVPYTVRAPQNYARHAPHRKYEFHRLLCPQFHLALARRWPKEISAERFNEIFENPDKAVDEISLYFLYKIFVDEFVEWASVELAEAKRFKEIYDGICKSEYNDKELFEKAGRAEIKGTLHGKFSLVKGKKSISCESREEAEYLKVFADLGLRSVAVPRDLDYLKELLPEIKKLEKRISSTISKKLDECPTLKKRRKNQIFLEIWMSFLGAKQ